MKPGEEFEKRCFEYLKQSYSNTSSTFERKGGMDSTTSDIAVMKNGVIQYYIEAKETQAQSGQFVVFADEKNRQFIFSPKNKSKQNEMTDFMIEYMNKNFDRFNSAGTSGEKIEMDAEIFSKWIIGHYQDRDVKYIISYNDDDYVIFPIRRFATYFDVLATYRTKKSGSSPPAKKDFQRVKGEIHKLYPKAEFIERDKKLFVKISEKVKIDRFVLDKYEYYLSHQEENEYEVRRLSNTKNRNVIFKIKLKKAQDLDDLDEFKSDL